VGNRHSVPFYRSRGTSSSPALAYRQPAQPRSFPLPGRGRASPLVDAHPRGPAGILLVDGDLVREGVAVGGGDGGYVVLVGVDVLHDLAHGREEGLLGCLADFCALCGCWFGLVS
jgi:hypothetical protein